MPPVDPSYADLITSDLDAHRQQMLSALRRLAKASHLVAALEVEATYNAMRSLIYLEQDAH